MKNKVNLAQLKEEIKQLKRWHPLYKLLKDELSALGYWREKPRGNPAKAYKRGMGKYK